MLNLIPVLDISAGVAVHARAGTRAGYRPVISVLTGEIGSARALAVAYRKVLGATQAYIADLDAIAGQAPQDDLVALLADPVAGFGPGLMVDAGIVTAERAQAVLALGVDRIVVGLETLASFQALRAILGAIGADRTIFSLDLRDGALIRWPTGAAPGREPTIPGLLAELMEAGVRTILLLDLARVGSGSGPDLDLVRLVGSRAPGASLLLGGGIHGPTDLATLAAAGCGGALVASTIHDGRLGAAAFSAPRDFA